MRKGDAVRDLTEEQQEAKRAADRWAHKMRERGTPLFVLPHEYARAVAIIKRAKASGMTDSQMASHCEIDESCIAKHRRGLYKTMKRAAYQRVLTMRPPVYATRMHETRGKLPDGAYVPLGHGVARRVQALRAKGFTSSFLGSVLGVTEQAVSQLATGGRPTCYKSTYLEVCALYDKYKDQEPTDCGISSTSALRCVSWARKLGFPPSHCWDDGWYDDDGVLHPPSIDDPQGFPDWTGACGTVQGYFLHLKYNMRVRVLQQRADRKTGRRLVLCTPCLDAKSIATSVRPTEVNREAMYEAFENGDGVRAIATDFRCSTRTVMRYRKEWIADA